MPISGDQQMNSDLCRYGLPTDSCVGDAGPSPTEVTAISKSAGKSPAQGGPVPVGYDGPSPS